MAKKDNMKPVPMPGSVSASPISLLQTLDAPVYKAAAKFARDKGLINVQTIIRISLSSFLTKEGYL